MAAMAGLGAWVLRRAAAPLSVSRFSMRLPEGQTFSVTVRRAVAISPDGRQLVYAANSRLYVRSLSEFEPHAIPGSDAQVPSSPVFSPDGAAVAFFADGFLRQLAISGGAAVTICPVSNPYGLAWDSSGLVFGQGRMGIFRCSANGGSPEQLATVNEGEIADGPQILPGGEAMLFTVAKASDGGDRWEKAQVVVQSLTSGTRKTLIEGGSDARYHAGYLLYAFGGDVFAAPFDLARPAVVGGRVPLLQGVRRSLNAGTGTAQLDLSNAGTLVYIPGPSGTSITARRVAKADRAGVVTRLLPRAASYVTVRATRDGARLALDTDDGKEADVWIYELDGKSDVRRLTFVGKNRSPIWSPDGQRVAYQSDREGDLAIFTQHIDGTGLERLSKPGPDEAHVPESWSPDGKHISFSALKSGGSSLWTLSLEDKKPLPFANVRSSGEPIGSVFSPNGRWIAYHSRPSVNGAPAPTNSRNIGIFVQPFPATGSLYQAPKLSIDFQPLWSRDGTELFYVPLAASGQLAAVRVNMRSGVTFGSPEKLPARVTSNRTSGLTRAFDILPDGTFVGLVSGSDEDVSLSVASTSEIRVVLNRFEELKARTAN
jgi:Tol biopolymer transport system component